MNEVLKKMIPWLAVVAAAFYLLPLLIRDTGSAMVVLLVALPVLCFFVAFAYGVKNRFHWVFPLLCGVLFVPSVFIFYNVSALPYALIYGVIALVGNLIAKLFVFRA